MRVATLRRCGEYAPIVIGGSDSGKLNLAMAVGSRGVSSVPVLSSHLGIGFRAQVRIVPLDGVALADSSVQAG